MLNNPSPPISTDCLQNVTPEFLDSSSLSEPFTVEEIEFALKKINVKSAPGHDGIKVPYLQNVPCSEFLCNLFNKCLELGESPLPWMCSIIKPIPKPGGNPLNPSDYRGISLQSCVTKILCFVMNVRLTEYVESNVLYIS